MTPGDRTLPLPPDSESMPDSTPLSPEEAMLRGEVRRIRAFAILLVAICALGAVVITQLGGDPLARRIHLGTVIGAGITAAVCAAFLDAARFRPGYVIALVGAGSVASVAGYYYWGYLSGYHAVLAFAAYLISVANVRGTVAVGVTIAVGGHLVIGIATITGVIEDRALLRSSELATFDQVATLILLNVIVLGAVVLGIQNHAETRRTLTENFVAFRELARREAQLAEAHAEARDAIAAGGRFTRQVLGRYRLGELIGRGSMGEIYAAEAIDGGAPFAVKLLAPHLRDNTDALRRFQREAHAIAALESPHIVCIVEISEIDAPVPYLVMERLVGADLNAVVKDEPIRPLAEVVEIVTQVSAGLDVAHAAGIVHRDLKLQNIFRVESDTTRTWKLLDFGVAKLTDSGGTLSQQQIVGTPGYMAPEQARGTSVDARTDVYALGVVAYRLLTGLPAVVPGEVPSMLHEVVYRMPPRPSSLVDLRPGVESVLAIALAKNPDLRFHSAGELARALTEAAAGRVDPTIANRAAAILARTPWGHWARQRTASIAPRLG